MKINFVWFGRLAGAVIVAVTLAGATAAGVQRQSSGPARAGGDQTAARIRPVCGTRPLSDQDRAADAARVAEFKKGRSGLQASTVTTIPTFVHVIHNGSEGRVSERTIKEQITVLNNAFAVHGFRFELAPSTRSNPNPDYTDNAAWFNDDEVAYKSALKEGSADDLNIYITNGGGYLGYAYYPTVVGTQYEVLDGLVLAYGTLPGAMQPGISDIPGYTYNLGDTGVHEIGHYLGLLHTFDGACSPTNDDIADTPAERSPDYDCTVGRNSCKDGNGPVELDPIHNFMDYSDDLCLFEFSLGQSERLNIQWQLYRQGRYVGGACACGVRLAGASSSGMRRSADPT